MNALPLFAISLTALILSACAQVHAPSDDVWNPMPIEYEEIEV